MASGSSLELIHAAEKASSKQGPSFNHEYFTYFGSSFRAPTLAQ